MSAAPRLYPTLRCRDAGAMIRWLVDVVGFAEHEVHRAGERIVHAQLSLGPSILMLGDARDDEYGAQVGPLDGRRTDALYVAVDDPDALCERVRASAATIVTDLHDTDYGSRDFAARDAQGNLWSFGTYRPTVDETARDIGPRP